MTPEQIAARRELVRRELARRELARRERAKIPLPKEQEEPVVFAPAGEVAEAAEAEVAEAAAERVAEAGYFEVPGRSVLQAEQREREALAAQQERQRGRVAMPGVRGPVEVTEGIFRPSRIQTVETFERPAPGTGVLLEPPEPERIAAADLPVPFDPLTLKPTLRRMYKDPETGTFSEPTLAQEFREAAALQTERGEEALRERQADIRRQQRELDAALAAGEPIPFYEQYVGNPISGVLSRAEQGVGVVETELTAALRAALSWGAVAAGDAYFRGLGYEVDENGYPLDPEDFGYEVAKIRESLGIPELVTPFGGVKGAARYYGEKAGLSAEDITTIENALDAIPQLAIPLPGVATESGTRKVTTFDPEGRRRVEDVEVPYPWEDPKGFIKAEARRITQNVAKGRTWGDEYLDSPATREFYAHATGDADNAYIAGMIPEILIPGPEVLLSAPGYLAGAAADVLRASRNLGPLIRAERAVKITAQQLKNARAADVPAAEIVRFEAAAEQALRRHAALSDAAGDYDPTLLRKVAEKSADKVLKNKSPEQLRDVRAALAASDRPETIGELTDTLRGLLAEDDVARITTLTQRNLPADFVSLTDTIAVPRSQLAAAKAALKEHRSAAFVKPSGEVLEDLFNLARKMPEGPKRDAVLKTYRSARAELDAVSAPARGYAGLGKSRRPVQNAIKAAARETGVEDAAEYVRRFDQRPPRDLPLGDTPLAKELAKYDSWQDVPATLRRRAVDSYDIAAAPKLARGARLSRDLTRAQLFFKSAGNGLLDDTFLRSRFMDSMRMRRFLARFGRLRTETKAVADIGREIRLAGKTALRTMETKLKAGIARFGNVEDAVDDLLKSELTQAGEGPQQAWEALWGMVYGDAVKDDLVAAVQESKALRMDEAGDFADYPTIQTATAIDRLFSDLEGVIPGVTPDLAEKAERVGLGGIVTPDFIPAFLKVTFENGLKKTIAARKRLTGAVQTAVDDVILNTDFTRATGETLLERAQAAVRIPGRGAVLPEDLSRQLGNRIQVYDKSAGTAEKALAEGAESLVVALEDIPVRERAAVGKMAADALDFVVGTGRRNISQRLQYGYIVPNLPVQVGRTLQMGLVPFFTIGARNALQAFDRAGQRALSALTRRRVLGGGLTTENGVYLSPKVLDDLADEYGLGLTQVETERVGSLASDMIRAAKRQARRVEDPDNADLVLSLEEMDPFSRGYFLRVAEAAELNFRKSVFEMALARGDAPQDAAELARGSQLNFQDVPDAVQRTLGKYVGESAFLYRAGTEALLAIAASPKRAARVLRTLRAKAEVQDPYNIHGDKALKSMGIIPKGDDEVYYLPEIPALQPVEAALGTIRSVDNLVDDLRFATTQSAGVMDALEGKPFTAGTAIQLGGEVIMPAVLQAYDRFQEGEEYKTTDVPDAKPLSDEQAFWAWMIIANNRDPEHTNGQWAAFTTLAPIKQVEPPADKASKSIPGAWTEQPPDGIPHVLVDVIDGEPAYFVAEPTPQALSNIRFARKMDVAGLDRLLPAYAILSERDRGTAPVSVFTEGRLPTTLTEAAGEALLGFEQADVQRELERQAGTVRDIREGIEIQ